jgi:isoleucyl-tRNA synthetase
MHPSAQTPLIYRAVPSWFVRVEDIKDRLLVNNEQTYWVPESVKGPSRGYWF